ncbi:MAG: flagellar hook-length control protein FliK [Pandoraea sp.]|nr:flagellar hook-length control protein FliK [Pandoraea sp.]MDR3397791.1 flagellar hook-length control protein FliK [Pandoraea sp.]
MIVEPVRLVTAITPASANPSAPVADGMLPVGLAEGLPSLDEGAAANDFAAVFGRLAAQGLESLPHEGDADAAAVAPEGATQAEAPEGLLADLAVGKPAVPVMPLTTPDVDEPALVSDAASDAASVTPTPPAAPKIVVPVADDLTLAAQDMSSPDSESLRDPVSPHIATLLAAHEHRMRGALSGQTPMARGEGAASASAALPGLAASASASASVSAAAAVSLPLGAPNPSLATLPLLRDAATPNVANVESSPTPSLRAAFSPATFGNAFVGEPAVAAMSGGQLAGNVTAGEGATVARTLAERVHAMTEKGVHEARLRLTPAELGDIGIVVRKSPMQLSVSLQVARPEALALVQGTAALLRDMLSQRHAGEVHVSVASMPSFNGHGTSGNPRERHSRDEPSGDAGPGLALGEAARERGQEREAFRL